MDENSKFEYEMHLLRLNHDVESAKVEELRHKAAIFRHFVDEYQKILETKPESAQSLMPLYHDRMHDCVNFTLQGYKETKKLVACTREMILKKRAHDEVSI
jgi:menaquinone-dependent protoporphyrinogen IX oxidase